MTRIFIFQFNYSILGNIYYYTTIIEMKKAKKSLRDIFESKLLMFCVKQVEVIFEIW